ncbi:MAG: spore coat associated protein CotJA [Acutalibacteraceae bacterium]|nr:spore coat associated protein CotJA [Acutalibacteraceae bacterium]
MFEYERKETWDMADSSCKQALTLVFIENQVLEQVYEPDTAFKRGTAFPELDKPFCPGGMKYE